MRILTVFLLAILVVILSGCETGNKQATSTSPKSAPTDKLIASQSQVREQSGQAASAVSFSSLAPKEQEVSLDQAATEQTSAAAADRKIIRNCQLTIETDSPSEEQHKITAIAESHGGFVITSEFKHSNANGHAKPSETVTVVIRVPSAQFAATLEQIRGVGGRVIQEKVTGEDVSEEYLDLEARIRTKKALEAQFLEIMKQARKVSEALEVQTQLANVRTEIERLEGRRRFLENQSALSTITATLQISAPLVAATTTGFGNSIKQAFGDAVDTAASIILFVIQAVIVLIPIVLLLGLPGWIVWRALRRRLVLTRKAEPVADSR